ncbi:hypothetical protein ClosIBUN13A_CONTIG156g02391 [Clostridium sp. IBUN13A]|mgnify:FL=1|nr:hypothetical protein ClosIBUN22A_CONTIG84g01885 [Clostridium sp. IBUN22A]KJZ89377.1 hypothetical protein ClosIBUN125C_CONTIG11g00845 [Clostridium sp. IBUN125C]KJZ89981.1 hypothetical protein ClosIBUN62F_CONTIG83g03342 [Clostridium sp. IBUN62F]KJZ96564.1 hypothetical protein ClosIBUN13A_CONTIG156g02391 [Clostridium sp. IBUN13A]
MLFILIDLLHRDFKVNYKILIAIYNKMNEHLIKFLTFLFKVIDFFATMKFRGGGGTF